MTCQNLDHKLPGPPGWGEALGQQPITRKKYSKAKNTTKQPPMKQILRRQKLRKRKMNIGTWNVQGIFNKMDDVI